MAQIELTETCMVKFLSLLMGLFFRLPFYFTLIFYCNMYWKTYENSFTIFKFLICDLNIYQLFKYIYQKNCSMFSFTDRGMIQNYEQNIRLLIFKTICRNKYCVQSWEIIQIEKYQIDVADILTN